MERNTHVSKEREIVQQRKEGNCSSFTHFYGCIINYHNSIKTLSIDLLDTTSSVAYCIVLKIGTHCVGVGSALHALQTCLFTDTHSRTHSYMPHDVVGRALAIQCTNHKNKLHMVFTHHS